MKKIAVLFCSFVAACNYDTGECYLRDEGGQGAGGGIIAPPGAGGFGDVPPEPQADTDSANPCGTQTAECTYTWKADSIVCKEKGTQGTCTTRFQCVHATLAEAQAACERTYGPNSGVLSCGSCRWVVSGNGDPVEQCKKLCDKLNEDCIARCPKGDKGCMNECNQEYGKCLKECEK
jgi:hypothetical protein